MSTFQRKIRRAHGNAHANLRANIPLLCTKGLTGYGAQCLTIEDGIILDGTWKGNVINASDPYTYVSRVRNSSMCVFLKPLRRINPLKQDTATVQNLERPLTLVKLLRYLRKLDDIGEGNY